MILLMPFIQRHQMNQTIEQADYRVLSVQGNPVSAHTSAAGV